MWDKLKCNAYECCDSPYWVRHNVSRFEEMFENHVFGQHIVKDIVSKQLRGHLKRTSPKKALVLSFHGKFYKTLYNNISREIILRFFRLDRFWKKLRGKIHRTEPFP